jgi:type II secretory ATPase GspE/PulE/Tfp pilus assembly ATPase PilB-like protein
LQGGDCKVCKNTRFSGRLAVHEVLKITSPLRQAIEEGGSANKISQIARQTGMETLQEQGQNLVKNGLTSPIEVKNQLGVVR